MVKSYVHIQGKRTIIFTNDGKVLSSKFKPHKLSGEEQRKQQDRIAVEAALKVYKERNLIDDLISEFEDKNPFIYHNKEAHSLIAAFLRGEITLEKGRKRTDKNIKRDRLICSAIAHLKEVTDLPIKDKTACNEAICDIVGRAFFLSGDAVYSVWREHKDDSLQKFDLVRIIMRSTHYPNNNPDEIASAYAKTQEG